MYILRIAAVSQKEANNILLVYLFRSRVLVLSSCSVYILYCDGSTGHSSLPTRQENGLRYMYVNQLYKLFIARHLIV